MCFYFIHLDFIFERLTFNMCFAAVSGTFFDTFEYLSTWFSPWFFLNGIKELPRQVLFYFSFARVLPSLPPCPYLEKLTSEALKQRKPNIRLTVPYYSHSGIGPKCTSNYRTHLLSVSQSRDHYYIQNIQKRNWRTSYPKEGAALIMSI